MKTFEHLAAIADFLETQFLFVSTFNIINVLPLKLSIRNDFT